MSDVDGYDRATLEAIVIDAWGDHYGQDEEELRETLADMSTEAIALKVENYFGEHFNDMYREYGE